MVPRMAAGSHVLLLKAPNVHKASHMLTDVTFWTEQFCLLSNIKHSNIQGIRTLINRQHKYLEKLKHTGLKGTDEKKFYGKVTSLNEILKCHLEDVPCNIDEYTKIHQKLTRFNDEISCSTEALNRRYRAARDSLAKQTRVVEAHRKYYHKLAFSIVRTTIEMSLTEGSRALREVRKRLDGLYERKDIDRLKYSEQIKKWNYIFSNAHILSIELEKSYISRETARAELILSCLQNMVDKTVAGKCDRREPLFTTIDGRRLVIEKVLAREIINVPTFQEYVRSVEDQKTKSELRVSLSTPNQASTIRGQIRTKASRDKTSMDDCYNLSSSHRRSSTRPHVTFRNDVDVTSNGDVTSKVVSGTSCRNGWK